MLGIVERWLVLVLGRCFGIGLVVRYLRNPNPRNTPWLLRRFGAEVGEGTMFKRAVLIDNSWEDEGATGDFSRLKVGKNCYVGDGVYLDLADRVEIEDDAVVSGQVSILTHADCNRSPYLREVYPRRTGPVRIGRGAWLGFGSTVMAGTGIGVESVVAAGAVVRGDTEPRCVYGGVPAVMIGKAERGA